MLESKLEDPKSIICWSYTVSNCLCCLPSLSHLFIFTGNFYRPLTEMPEEESDPCYVEPFLTDIIEVVALG